MSDEALAALKLIPAWFVTSKLIEKRYTVLHADDGLVFIDEDSGDVTFCCNEVGILGLKFININLDNNFDEDDPDILIRFLA